MITKTEEDKLMEKADYKEIEIEVIVFEGEDVICSSLKGFHNYDPETGEMIPYHP